MDPITETVDVTPPTTETVVLGKLAVTVRELTPAQVDAWLAGKDAPKYPALFDMMYGEKLLTGDVVLACTDLTPKEMMALPPHCVEKIVGKIRCLNTFFVAMLGPGGSLQRKLDAISAASAPA